MHSKDILQHGENLKDFHQLTENSTPDFHSSLTKTQTFFSSTHAKTLEQLEVMQVTGVGVKMSNATIKYSITMNKMQTIKMYGSNNQEVGRSHGSLEPLIRALRRQRQVDFCEFQASQAYIVKFNLNHYEKEGKGKKKEKEVG